MWGMFPQDQVSNFKLSINQYIGLNNPQLLTPKKRSQLIPMRVRNAEKIHQDLKYKPIIDGYLGVPIKTHINRNRHAVMISCDKSDELTKTENFPDSFYGKLQPLFNNMRKPAKAIFSEAQVRLAPNITSFSPLIDVMMSRLYHKIPMPYKFSQDEKQQMIESHKWECIKHWFVS